MALLESHHNRLDKVIGHNQLDFPFLHLLDHSCLPEKWLTAIKRAELTVAEHLPCALVVSADSPCSSSEYGALDLVHMARRNKERELVHAP